MNLLGAKLYDPGTAVNKVTTAAIAMTAIDTTNLRIAFTIPAHGYVRVRLMAVIHGATTYPNIMLGVMNGATVVGRTAPVQSLGNTATATALVNVEADFVINGLTPGAVNWDAAYGVETLVAATGLKYGGPNNTTANDAFGGFVFEVWDPQSVPTVAPGAANGLQICGANAATTYATLTSTGAFTVSGVATVSQTGDSFAVVKSGGTGDNAAVKAKTDLIPAAPASTTNITAGTITTTTNLTNAPTAGDLTATMKTSVTTAASAATPAVTVSDKTGFSLSTAGILAIWHQLTSAIVTAGTIGKLILDNLNATISSRSSHVASDVWAVATRLLTAGTNIVLAKGTGVTGFNDLDAAGVRGAVGLASANLDTQIDALPTNAELATALGTADDAVLAQVALVKAKTDLIPAAPAAVSDIPNVVAIAKAMFQEDTAETYGSAVTGSVVKEIADNAGSGLDAAGVRAAVGLASANLDTQIGDLPTNAELATSQASADDATLAAIAALNNLSQANVRTAVGLATANLDTQLDALPTNAELATSQAAADDATLAAIAGLSIPTAAAISDAVWDEATAGHVTAGTTGKALTDAGSAGDPWGTALPGAYGAGTAGKLIGDNVDSPISGAGGGSALTLREEMTARLPDIPVPPNFKHTPPVDKPTVPDASGLTAPELAEVELWKTTWAAPSLAAAITYVADYEDYNMAYAAWKIADQTARISQWRILMGDALIYNKPTTSESADDTGAGSSPPPHSVYPRLDP